MNPLVSIIIPAYNAESFISKALDSCIKQTYENIEVIVVDDVSTDNTVKIISSYCQRDKRIHLYQNEKNMGPSGNRNVCLAHATGKYVTFLDNDDWFELDAIENLVKNHIDGWFTLSKFYNVKKINGNYKRDDYKLGERPVFKKSLNEKSPVEWICSTDWYWTIFVTPWAKLFELKIIVENHLEYENVLGEDVLFNYFYIEHTKGVNYIDCFTYNNFHNQISLSRSLSGMYLVTEEDYIHSILKSRNNFSKKEQELLKTQYAHRMLARKKNSVFTKGLSKDLKSEINKNFKENYKILMKSNHSSFPDKVYAFTARRLPDFVLKAMISLSRAVQD